MPANQIGVTKTSVVIKGESIAAVPKWNDVLNDNEFCA